jgi:anti-sigma factor RsiW
MTVPLDPCCARVRARLPELVDGALAPLAAALDQGHLEACAGCAREEAELLRTLACVRALARSEAHELTPLHAQILARLAPRPRVLAGERSYLLAAAAALILFALGSWFGLPSAPRAEDFSHLDVLSELSDWSGVLRGLEDLTRRFS